MCVERLPIALGTEEEWVSLGARRSQWWELAEIDVPDARFFHDAALAGVMAGYMPALRPKVVRTLKAPEHAASPCTMQGCKFKDCTGNTTFWQDKEKTVLAFRQVVDGGL
jgi:hypothetical protein